MCYNRGNPHRTSAGLVKSSVFFMPHPLIDKLFNRRGIKDINDLQPEEKATYENWEKILSKEELTMADLKEFCKTQIAVIEGKWSDYAVDNAKKAEMIPYHTVYKTLLLAIDSPRSAREAMEIQLQQLIKQ